jgi:hypothetical protein
VRKIESGGQSKYFFVKIAFRRQMGPFAPNPMGIFRAPIGENLPWFRRHGRENFAQWLGCDNL